VWTGSQDIEAVIEPFHHGSSFQKESKILYKIGRPVAQVGNGSFFDLAVLAIGFSKEDTWWRLPIGYGFYIHDHY